MKWLRQRRRSSDEILSYLREHIANVHVERLAPSKYWVTQKGRVLCELQWNYDDDKFVLIAEVDAPTPQLAQITWILTQKLRGMEVCGTPCCVCNNGKVLYGDEAILHSAYQSIGVSSDEVH